MCLKNTKCENIGLPKCKIEEEIHASGVQIL